MSLSKNEKLMWNDSKSRVPTDLSTKEINTKYQRGEQRIVTESNREKLPNFVDALSRPGYMELRPFYQRRSRWDESRQSRLIESFIINIPVPPVFLYEKAYNQYEVMDGQQRITAIKTFYNNDFALKGLELWPELNGMKYKDLPKNVKDGLDRRSISSIVLLKESAPDDEDAILLRQLVFERLNTGGIKLERQEIRNALNEGKLNELLIKLSRLDNFRKVWELPLYTEEEETNHNLPIYEKPFFQKMEDLEVVLRFFTLRHMSEYKYGLQGFLDLYIIRANKFSKEDIQFLGDLFSGTLDTCLEIFGEHAFKIYEIEKAEWRKKPSKSVYDAQMIALSEILHKKDHLIKNKNKILKLTLEIFEGEGVSILTGRASTKADVENRIQLFRDIFSQV